MNRSTIARSLGLSLAFCWLGSPGLARMEPGLATLRQATPGQAAPGQAEQALPQPGTELADVEQRVEAFLQIAAILRSKTKTPGAAMAVMAEGEFVYRGALGFANLERAEPVTEDTLFAIGSCTKALTGVLASRAVARSQLDWHTPMRELLEEFRLPEAYKTEHASLQDLLTHMTGVAPYNMLWYGADLDRSELLASLPQLESLSSLRRGYIYNNLMYSVVGLALERTCGRSFDDQIRAEIFAPLGMTTSTTTYAEFIAHEHRSTGYAADGVTPLPHLDIDVVGPAGSVGSNLRDMSQWLAMIARGGVHGDEFFLSASDFAYLTGPQVVLDPTAKAFYGIGWEVTWERGHWVIGHGGGIVGQNCFVRAIPGEGYGIVILSNQQSDFDDLLVRYAEDIFVRGRLERDTAWEARLERAAQVHDLSAYPIDFEAPIAPNGDAPFRCERAEDYAGEYVHGGFPSVRITSPGEGRLNFHYNVFEGPISHAHGETFFAHHDPLDPRRAFELEFVLDGSESVSGLEFELQGGVPALLFERLPIEAAQERR